MQHKSVPEVITMFAACATLPSATHTSAGRDQHMLAEAELVTQVHKQTATDTTSSQAKQPRLLVKAKDSQVRDTA